jgi:RHS repeat-associated protein
VFELVEHGHDEVKSIQVKPFQHTAREWDTETGLYYYRARYYDPQTGRLISEDPLGFSGGENFYSYGDNEPTDFEDAAGLCPQKKPRPCPAKLPQNPRRRTMVATVLGEETGEGYVGSNRYADDQSGNVKDIGGPEGPVITDETLDLEAQLLASTMMNLGHIGNSRTYVGLPRGRGLAIKGLKAPEGSPLCKMLQRAIGAVDTALDSPVPLSPFSQWRSVQQGDWVRPKGSALRVANTDFY